jgi:hypothetical protein
VVVAAGGAVVVVATVVVWGGVGFVVVPDGAGGSDVVLGPEPTGGVAVVGGAVVDVVEVVDVVVAVADPVPGTSSEAADSTPTRSPCPNQRTTAGRCVRRWERVAVQPPGGPPGRDRHPRAVSATIGPPLGVRKRSRGRPNCSDRAGGSSALDGHDARAHPYINEPGVVSNSPVSSHVLRPERIIGQPP